MPWDLISVCCYKHKEKPLLALHPASGHDCLVELQKCTAILEQKDMVKGGGAEGWMNGKDVLCDGKGNPRRIVCSIDWGAGELQRGASAHVLSTNVHTCIQTWPQRGKLHRHACIVIPDSRVTHTYIMVRRGWIGWAIHSCYSFLSVFSFFRCFWAQVLAICNHVHLCDVSCDCLLTCNCVKRAGLSICNVGPHQCLMQSPLPLPFLSLPLSIPLALSLSLWKPPTIWYWSTKGC